MDLGLEDWLDALNNNTLIQIQRTKAVLARAIARRFGPTVNLSSLSVDESIPDRALGNGVGAGLAGLCAGLGEKTVRYEVTIHPIVPGRLVTERSMRSARLRAERARISVEAHLETLQGSLPAGRLGGAADYADACAYLCGAQAGDVSASPPRLDDGAARGIY